MKRILSLLVLLLVSFIGFAQAPSNYTNINGRYRWMAGMFDSTFSLPKGTTPSLRTGGSTNPGAVFYRTTDSSLYIYTGNQWLKQANASGFVPYTGATQNVNLGQYGLKSKYLEFDTSSQAVTERRLQWSNADGTLQFGMTNGSTITNRIGLEQFARVKNVDATQINKGDVVYLYGASGDRASVKKADNRSDATSSKTLGVATENIAVNDVGFVGTFGVVGKLNLSAYNPGDILYLDSIPGKMTKTKPQAPYHLVFIGIVERANSGNGLLFVNPQNGYELEELHNVRITSPVRNNALLAYDSVRALWVDTTLGAIGGISGNLVSGYLTKATGANTIDTSQIYQNDGRIGIGTTSPTQKLDLNGNAYVNGQVLAGDTSLSKIYIQSAEFTPTVLARKAVTNTLSGDARTIAVLGQTIARGEVANRLIGGAFFTQTDSSNAQNISQLRALQGWTLHNGTGIITNGWGTYNVISNNQTGTITNAYGSVSGVENRTTGYIPKLHGQSVEVWNLGGGTMDTVFGQTVSIYNSNPASTIGAVYGVSIGKGMITNTGGTHYWRNSGTINRSYGLYLDTSIDVGLTEKYAIYSFSRSNSYFNGNLGVGTSSPTSKLHVYDSLAPRVVQIQNRSVGGNIALDVTSTGVSGLAFRIEQKDSATTGTQYVGIFNKGQMAGTGNPENGAGVGWYTNVGNDAGIYRPLSVYRARITDSTGFTNTSVKGSSTEFWTRKNNAWDTTLVLNQGNVGVGTGQNGIDSSLTVANGTWLKSGVRMSGLPTTSGTKALRVDANGTLSISDTLANGVSGSGTTNYVPLWNGTTSLTNSLISQTSGAINLGGQLNITSGTPITLGQQVLQLPTGVSSTINAGLSVRTGVAGESIIQLGNNLNTYYTGLTDATKPGVMIRLDTRGQTPIPGGFAYSVFQIQTRAAGVANPNYTVPVQIAPSPNGSFVIDASGRGYFYNGMRVGASTSAPTNALSVTGNVDASGRLGIGTTSPATRLSILGDWVGSTGQLEINASSGQRYSGLSFKINSTFKSALYHDNTDNFLEIYATASQGQRFYTNDAERMRITSGGNVGIGLTNPESYNSGGNSFVIGGGAFKGLTIAATTEGNIYFADGTTGSETYRGSMGYNHTSDYLYFYSAANERMRLNSTGELLINTTSDAGNYKLQVNGNSFFNSDIVVSGTSIGYITLTPGAANNSGFLNFYSSAGNRQGYIGYSGTNNSTDTGTIPYVAGKHDFTGAIQTNSTIKTAAPSGGTATTWKLGSKVAASVTLDTANYIEVEVNGVAYKLAIVN